MNPFHAISDDFAVYVYINTKMELPGNRETVLHFFDSLRKTFPEMTEFEQRPTGEYVLEEDRELGSYRWVALEPHRLCIGFVNPPTLDEVDALNERILEIAPFYLGLNALDCESLDVLFSFDFFYAGNHDEVVADAFGAHSPLDSLIHLPGSQLLQFEPSVTLALDESCRLQGRLHVETRTNAYQIRTRQYSEIPISVYFTVRQYWNRQPYASFGESYQQQRRIAAELLESIVVPQILRPLAQTIETRQ